MLREAWLLHRGVVDQVVQAVVVERMVMDERGAWRIDLDGGQRIRLGKRNVTDRLNRFFGYVLPALAGELDRVRYVDMRYTNGFAVAWVDELELSRAGASEVIGGA